MWPNLTLSITETQNPVGRTMTVSIIYPTPLGADECDSIVGGLVIKSYPYYLDEATFACVASGKKLQNFFLKT